MTKQEKIDEYLNQPLKVGESVYVRGLGSQNKTTFSNTAEVLEVNTDGSIVIDEYKSHTTIQPENYKKVTYTIGVNPFPEYQWNTSLRMISFNLYSILHSIGLEKRERIINVEELCWSPFIIDENGNEVEYQRELCWTLEQKQLLIESIYNDINIGTIIVRKRDYGWVKERVDSGKVGCFKDIVDGKQRLNALLGFVMGEFKDLHGNKWDDLSDQAQNEFLNFNSLGYGEIGENASDVDVQKVFLNINFSGVQMSQEHIDFVNSIKCK
jgi:hypothetical protein